MKLHESCLSTILDLSGIGAVSVFISHHAGRIILFSIIRLHMKYEKIKAQEGWVTGPNLYKEYPMSGQIAARS